MNNFITNFKKKRLYKFLVNADQKKLEKYINKVSKKPIKEHHFNKVVLFKSDVDKLVHGSIDDLRNMNCMYNARDIEKIAMVDKCESYLNSELLSRDLGSNKMAIKLALYDLDAIDPKYKTYKMKISNPNSFEYIKELENAVNNKDKELFIVNGFFYKIFMYKFVGGNNNEAIIYLNRI